MKNNLSTIFEVIWFVMGGLLLFMAVDVNMNAGLNNSWYYYLFSVLSFFMYARRRKMRMNARK